MALNTWFSRIRNLDVRVLASIGATLLLVGGVMWVVPTTPDSNSFKFDETRRDTSNARPIELGRKLEGRIVDGSDVDFYRIAPLQSALRLDIRMTSGSPTMIPGLRVFDAKKALVEDKAPEYQRRPGADVDCTFLAQSNTTYYVEVFAQRNTPGPYGLIVSVRQP